MIEAHTLDAWTVPADRGTVAYGLAMLLGGMGAPLFLFLAGVSVSLAAGSRSVRIGDQAAARTVRRRGWEILGLAFLFRLWCWALSPGAPARGLLKVDVLNIMGPAIVTAAAAWGAGRTLRGRVLLLSAATVLVAIATPFVRQTPWLAPVPDPLEAYLRPAPALTTFTLFPWAAFVTAGAVCGLVVQRAGQAGAASAAAGCAAAGAALVAAGYGLSWRPALFAGASFWTSSPTFFFIRLGVLSMAIAVAFSWSRRPWRRLFHSPLETLGASSLFVYWIHVEMVYGALSTPLRRSLPLPWALVACALFAGLMFCATLAKEAAVARWRARRGDVEGVHSACRPK